MRDMETLKKKLLIAQKKTVSQLDMLATLCYSYIWDNMGLKATAQPKMIVILCNKLVPAFEMVASKIGTNCNYSQSASSLSSK